MNFSADPTFAILAIAHLMRCESVLSRAATTLEPEDFDSASEQSYQLLWAIAKDWYTQYKTPIEQEYAEIEVRKRLSEDLSDLLSEALLQETMTNIRVVYSIPVELFKPGYILDWLQLFLNERRVVPTLRDVQEADRLDEHMASVQQVYTSTRLARGDTIELFVSGQEQMMAGDKYRIAFAPFNELIGGGFSTGGDLIGLLGPSGGGKTTLALQVACEHAALRKHTAVFTYEMSLRPALSRRLYGFLGGIPRTVLQSAKDITKLDPRYLEPLRRVQDSYAKEFLHTVDMKSDPAAGAAGVESIRSVLQEYDRRGQHIELVVLDQFIPLINRYLSGLRLKVDSSTRRMYMQVVVDQLNILAEQLACNILLVHQSSSDVKKRPAHQKPRQGESLEDRSFDNWMPYCIVVGTHDREYRCWLTNTKAREATEIDYIVRLDGEFYRFVYEADRYRVTRSGFIDVTQNATQPSFVSPQAADSGAGAWARAAQII